MNEDFHTSVNGLDQTPAPFANSAVGKRLLEKLKDGSPQQRRLAEHLLRNPVTAASRGIDDLAASAAVSPATVSRFARDFGCASYAAFRILLGDAIGEALDPVSKLREGFGRKGGEGAAAESLAAARAHLDALAGPRTAAQIRALARRIGPARYVYVMGFGMSAHLAAMLALGLQPYRDGVINVVQFGGTEVAAGRILGAAAGDLLIAISFPRYASDAVHLARYARDQGARIAAITDSVASPLARYADDLLTAPALHPVLSSSSLPGLAMIEALAAEFVLSDPAHMARAETLSKAIGKYLAPSEVVPVFRTDLQRS